MQLQLKRNESVLTYAMCVLCNQRFELKEARVTVCNQKGSSCGYICPQCIALDSKWLGKNRTPKLKWRQSKLLVRLTQLKQPEMPALESQEWLVDCLKRSTVRLISLTTDLGEEKLSFWADACAQAGKPIFLKIPNTPDLPHKKAGASWRLKRLIDQIVAALLLLILSPVMLGLALVILSQSPHSSIFFCQWRVGKRGRLFKIFKFRTMVVGAEQLHHQVMGQPGLHKHKDDRRPTPIGHWMRKYSLDKLPQLFNVLRGEMSLVGPRPWALYDAVRIRPDMQKRMNALPGIIGIWQVTARSNSLSIDAVNRCDLRYLRRWSLWRDLQILLLTVPKVLSGFGAY